MTCERPPRPIHLVFFTLFITTVASTYLETTSAPKVVAGSCPPYWISIRGICLTSGLFRNDCDTQGGIYLLELCFKLLKTTREVQETAFARKEASEAVYFEGFGRFCCGQGYGK